VASGPILIGYDGSPIAEHAVRSAAELLGAGKALVVVVWESGSAFELAESYAPVPGEAMVPIDVRGAEEVDHALYETAQKTASQGAAIAREAGLDAEGIAVADDITVPETLVKVADEHEAAAIVVGAHNKGRLSKLFLGSVSQGVLRRSTRPVLVVREAAAD
jgi:nucleotide-binding universal stress UspA family protein